MSVISIDDFSIRPINSIGVGMRTTTNISYIDGLIDDRLTTMVVYGYGLPHPDALRVAVSEVVTEFAKLSMLPQDKVRTIAELRREDEQSPACHYSRECSICLTASPSSRAVLTACGHIFCMACVLSMEVRGRLDCPYCRKASRYVKIYESKEEIENEEEETEDNNEEVQSSLAFSTLSPSEEAAHLSTAPLPTASYTSLPLDTVDFPRPTAVSTSTAEFSRQPSFLQRIIAHFFNRNVPSFNTPSSMPISTVSPPPGTVSLDTVFPLT